MTGDATSAYAHIPDLLKELTIPKDGILSRAVYADDRLKAVMFGFDTGQELSEHTAAMPAVIEIIDGDADVLLGEDRHHATPGTWIHMAAGTHHAIRAISPLTMLLLLLRDPSEPAAGD